MRRGEGEQQPHHIVVVSRRRCIAAANPVEQIGIAAFEKRFVAVELACVEAGKMGLGKATENEVALPRPPVPRPEQQAFAAKIGGG